MATWENPIFDRTQADVDFAIAQIAEWRKSGVITSRYLKGCLNVTDLNRIEGNIQYLSDELSSLCYFPHASVVFWETNGLPTVSDVNRILSNIGKIISAYYQYPSAPSLPSTMLRFEHINDIEKNLYLLKEMLDNMVSSFRECGTFYCGED